MNKLFESLLKEDTYRTDSIDDTAKAFDAELKALLAKYNANICVDEDSGEVTVYFNDTDKVYAWDVNEGITEMELYHDIDDDDDDDDDDIWDD